MHIVLVTPLYPPDIADPAPYVKELAQRLSGHQVTIVTYGRLPEAVPGVRILSVDKSQNILLRLIRCTVALLGTARGADIIYVQNGPSIELPALVAALFTRTPLVYGLTDMTAHEYAQRHFFRRTLERLLLVRASGVVTELPSRRPEILPLEPYPSDAVALYEAAWKDHCEGLKTIFTHAA